MTQYRKQIGDNLLIWGYDRPMSEYFIQLHDADEDLVFAIGNYTTMELHPDHPERKRWSNGQLLEVFTQYKEHIPPDHIEALCMDFPF